MYLCNFCRIDFFLSLLCLNPISLFCWCLLQKAKALHQKKGAGNEAFRVGKLQDALTLYSEALGIDPNNVITNSKLYNNRATVLAKVSDRPHVDSPWPKTIKKTTNSTPNKSQTQHARAYKVGTTKLRNFWAQIVSWAPRRARDFFIVLAVYFCECERVRHVIWHTQQCMWLVATNHLQLIFKCSTSLQIAHHKSSSFSAQCIVNAQFDLNL